MFALQHNLPGFSKQGGLHSGRATTKLLPNLQHPQKRPLLPCASKSNGYSWGMAGRGRPGQNSSGSTADRLRADEPLLKRHEEGYRMQPADDSKEAEAALGSTAPTSYSNGAPSANGAHSSTSRSSGGGGVAEMSTPKRDPAHAAAALKRGSEPKVLVSKSVLESLTSNLKSIQLARSSWSVKMQELQADMAQKVRAHEATERLLREAQLEKRSMALKLQQTEDALAQLQELQQQQLALLTSMQSQQREREQQEQLQALAAEGWLDPQAPQYQELEEADQLERAASPSPPPEEAPAAGTCLATISIRKETRPGENVYMVGNQAFCGNWVPKDALKLKWTEGHVWRRTFDVPHGVEVCFKMIELKDTGESNWESGGDRRFTVAPGSPHGIDLVCEWDRTHKMQVNPSR